RPVSTGYTGQSAIGPERSEGRRLEALAGIQGLYPKSKPPAMRVVLISSDFEKCVLAKRARGKSLVY
ncbi:MAG: hypothetical protein Q3X49_05890, partial [Slackia sp.]|uniref:hypothetical protein n=1 Tax=Slackia sp. TaxID=2049041 RepID=UPI0028459625